MALSTRRSDRTATTPTSSWDPLQELELLQSRMGHLLHGAWPDAGAAGGMPWVPAVDVEETDDAWIVDAELPGVRKQDVNIELRGGELAIHGEVLERERKGILRHRTRRVGRFEYHLTLPSEVDADAIDASMDDGVLTLRIPKPQQNQPRRIDVHAR
jgi:HSP20 family protein